ncbi:MAG: ABC transporter permease subunit [Geminicoccaceae bacterium]
MSDRLVTKSLVGLYLVVFFGFLFGPLIVMSITAFNSSSFPRAYPFDCLTFEWFVRLYEDDRLRMGLRNSLIIGAGVVVLSVALGLAGALFLTQVVPKARSTTYTVLTSPILMPGVVIGIATTLFWDRAAGSMGLSYNSLLYNGLLLSMLGQTSFIAAYCLLVFLSRLQRFDLAQIEAALDLGATNTQAFRKILLPFLRPAIFSAAVVAFLASFENYNTSVFTIGHYNTFTIEVAQKVRLGIDPRISALAVVVIVLTLFLALVHESWVSTAEQRLHGLFRDAGTGRILGAILANPAAILAVLVLSGGIFVAFYATRYDPAACKAAVLQERQERQRQLQESGPTTPSATPAAPAPAGSGSNRQAPGAFGNAFKPGNLAPATPEPQSSVPAKPVPGTFGNAFKPGNLAPAAPAETPGAAPASPGAAVSPPANGAFGEAFKPNNLAPGTPGDPAVPSAPAQAPGGNPPGGAFAPDNLRPAAPANRAAGLRPAGQPRPWR